MRNFCMSLSTIWLVLAVITTGNLHAGKRAKNALPPFEEVTRGMERIPGWFTFYRDRERGKVLMEIAPEQLERIFLCTITREAGDGSVFDSSAMLSGFPFVLKRVGERVQFIHKNVYYRAALDAPILRALRRGVTDSILGSTTIVAAPQRRTGHLLVDANRLFIQDITLVTSTFQRMEMSYAFDPENSYFKEVKSFPENAEIEVVLHYRTETPPDHLPSLPDARSLLHTYHYSLSKLPESNYRPRIADDRIGHFVTIYQDYTSVLRDTAYRRYINRWHLEKAEPRFKTSLVKEPIVFSLENTIPIEYRQAVREGILLWNKAFERIGFRNAIVVSQQPDGESPPWDPADTRFHTVRWIVNPGGGYAVGPSRTNPFTGEIYDADIRISADYIRYALLSYENFTLPLSLLETEKRGIVARLFPGQNTCDYWYEAAIDAAFARQVMTAGITGGEGMSEEEYIHDLLVHLVAHEVGHTLGLRHNFKASTIHTQEELRDSDLPTALTGSVMDYVPANISPKGKKQGRYFQTQLGPYDYWAIEYAYKPVDEKSLKSERAMLEEIASRASDPMLPYCTDEDAFGPPRGIDPTCNRFDLGSDPLRYHEIRIELAKELWQTMEAHFEPKIERYPKLRVIFSMGLAQYFTAVRNVTKFIGGIYHRRDHIDDPGHRLPFEPVPAAKQRAALTFLTKQIFGPDAFQFSPTLLRKLAPERLSDFEGSVWEMKRIDFPIHDTILHLQKIPLDALYSPLLLDRLLDLELQVSGEESPFTMAELFTTLRDAIWAELSSGRAINSFRRNLQRLHLDEIIGIALGSGGEMPADARSLARADLRVLAERIGERIGQGDLDPFTAAHLDESKARIDAAIAAIANRKIPSHR